MTDNAELATTASLSTGRKRPHVSSACKTCRTKRVRCDGAQPCEACVRSGSNCSYTKDGRRSDERSEPVRRLQEQVNELQAKFEILRAGTEVEALKALNDLRAENSGVSNTSSGRALSALSSLRFSAVSLSAIAEDKCSRQSQVQTTSQSSGRTPVAYSTTDPPPRDVVRQCAKFFFDVVEGICYVVTADEFDILYDKVYSGQRVDMSDVVEICAVAAIGSHYLDRIDQVPDDLKDALFRTAIQNINDLIDTSIIRSIRVLICISMYGIIEKRRSTRAIIHLALQQCRWSVEEQGTAHDASRIRVKLFRSMIFLECWLATSLGYQPAVTGDEILNVLRASKTEFEKTLSNETQVKMTEVGLLKASVLQDVYSPQMPNSAVIRYHMRKLEDWHETLPKYMTLQALLSGDTGPLTAAEGGALILGHAMYRGTIILLHHRILATEAASVASTNPLIAPPLHEVQETLERSIEAARLICRIFEYLGFTSEGSSLHFRCWLSAFEIYTATAVLLCSVALSYVAHCADQTGALEDLDRAEKCLKMLETGGKFDRVTFRLHQTLVPIHAALTGVEEPSGLFECGSGGYTEGAQNMLPRSELCACSIARSLLGDIAHILRNPFGHAETIAPDLLARDSGPSFPDWWEESTW